MKGYTQTNRDTVSEDSIEKWTYEQCKEYLQKYPKGLSAEVVSRRLEKVKPKTKKPQQSTSHTNTTTTSNNNRDKSTGITKPKQDYSEQIFETIACLAVGAGLIWLFASLGWKVPIYVIAASLTYGMKEIWNW